MAFIPNTKMNLNLIFKTFKGVCWINTKHFFVNRPIDTNRKKLDLTIQRQKQKQKDWRVCPDSFLQKLEIRGYALNTAKTYISCFEKFINHYDVQGWKFIRVEVISAYVSGENGCFGLGATPGHTANKQMVVFQKK